MSVGVTEKCRASASNDAVRADSGIDGLGVACSRRRAGRAVSDKSTRATSAARRGVGSRRRGTSESRRVQIKSTQGRRRAPACRRWRAHMDATALRQLRDSLVGRRRRKLEACQASRVAPCARSVAVHAEVVQSHRARRPGGSRPSVRCYRRPDHRATGAVCVSAQASVRLPGS